ncbi:hypothetical protein ACFL9T_22505, partial [Thermodesulfobacteriota bacterium]
MNLFGGGIAYGANPTGNVAARLPMVRLAVPLPNKLGNWFFALAENTGQFTSGVPDASGTGDYDHNIPKIVSTLRLNFAPTSWLLYGGYQTYDEVGRAATGAETEYSIDSWEVGLSGNATFGPFSAGANIWTGQNLAEYTGVVALNLGTTAAPIPLNLGLSVPFLAAYNANTLGIEDSDSWG